MSLAEKIMRSLVALSLVVCLGLPSARAAAYAQGQSATQPQQPSAEKPSPEKKSEPAKEAKPASSEPQSIGGELAKETREAEGEEENSNLKHSARVKWVAKITGLSVHGAHLLLLILNFALVACLIFLICRKGLPGILPDVPSVWRKRGESIQRALEEARAASQEASRRLADIESRLQQMDVEIGRMQASAEKEAQSEEERTKKAAEDEIRKVVEAAEQEIAAAAKQARRELSTHTADLAVTLARRQINVDANTDQVLVRNFASKLASRPEPKGDGGKDGH